MGSTPVGGSEKSFSEYYDFNNSSVTFSRDRRASYTFYQQDTPNENEQLADYSVPADRSFCPKFI